MLQAVIFDVDGLLVDTEWPDYVAWRELFQEYGGDLSPEEWVGEVGLWEPTAIWERFARLRGTTDGSEALYERRRARYRELVQASLEPMPGALALIAALEERRIPRGVASTSDREWVAFVLGGLELIQRMDAIVTGDDVAARKPAPDVYLTAAARLGVAPSACVALEDSAVGVAAARAAGICCVAVPNRLTVRHDLSAAHARVTSLAAIDLPWLERLLL